MSLITTNSKVSNRPEHYDNNYPQPIVITPNSQICLQKFIHSRDTDAFEITQENNVILFKWGQAATTGVGAYNPQRTAVLNTGVYTGAELATEVARALNAANQQQNFLFECAFQEDPTAVFPAPTRTFTITTSQPASGTFTQNGGTWTSNGPATQIEVANNDTAGQKSTIKFLRVGNTYGDDAFMRRGILTHGGSHSVEGIKVNKDGNMSGISVGAVSNAISTETGDPVPGDGAGFNFDRDLQDLRCEFLEDAADPTSAGIEIHDLRYIQGQAPGSSGWRRERLLRTIPSSVLAAIRALANFRDLRLTILTIQHQSANVANTGGNWLVRLEYNDTTGTLQQIPAGTGGQLASFADGNVDAIQDLTIAGETYNGCVLFTGQSQFFQNQAAPASGSFVRASRAAYIPTLTCNRAVDNRELVWYDLDSGNDWLSGLGTKAVWTNLVGDDPDIAGIIAGSVNRGYVFRVEVRDIATDVLIITYFARPQVDATGNRGISQLNWDMVISPTLPAGGAAPDHILSITNVVGAAPTFSGLAGGAPQTWTGSNAINGVLDEPTFSINGYYNLESRQTSPPVLTLNGAGVIVPAEGEVLGIDAEPDAEDEAGTGTFVADPLLAPPLVAELPRTLFITFDSEPSAANQSVATISGILGFLRGTQTGTPNYYYSNSSPAGSVPTYPYPLVNQVQPTAIAGDTTLHISIPQLNNIKTYEGARTDLLPGAPNNNSASNGDITNTIAVIPRQEFTSDRDQGELVYVSPFLDWVNINNKTELQINQLSVLVRNADGTLAKDLKRETTAIFKIREDPEAARERREDARIERFAKMIQNQIDRSVEFTGS